MLDCCVWNSPELYDTFKVGQTIKIRRPMLKITNKMFSNISEYTISINPDTVEYKIGKIYNSWKMNVMCFKESDAQKEVFNVESLSSICLKYIASYFSVTLYSREPTQENDPIPCIQINYFCSHSVFSVFKS